MATSSKPDMAAEIENKHGIHELHAASKDWNCFLLSSPIDIKHSDVIAMEHLSHADTTHLNVFNGKRGLKFKLQSLMKFELQCAIFWPAEIYNHVTGESVWQDPEMLNFISVRNCVLNAVNSAIESMHNTNTKSEYASRNPLFYPNSDSLVRIFNQDLGTFGRRFRDDLVAEFGRLETGFKDADSILIVKNLPPILNNDCSFHEQVNISLRGDVLEEVAISYKHLFAHHGTCLYWDRQALQRSFGHPWLSEYQGFSSSACGKFEWYADSLNTIIPESDTGHTSSEYGLPVAKRLIARTDFFNEKETQGVFPFNEPVIASLLGENSNVNKLESYLEGLETSKAYMDKLRNPEAPKGITARLETLVVVHKPTSIWVETCQNYVEKYFGSSNKSCLRSLPYDKFIEYQNWTTGLLLDTFVEIVRATTTARRLNPAFYISDNQRSLASYCEALLCWAVHGTLDAPNAIKKYSQIKIAEPLKLTAPTFWMLGDEDKNKPPFLGLEFAKNAIRVVDGTLQLVHSDVGNREADMEEAKDQADRWAQMVNTPEIE